MVIAEIFIYTPKNQVSVEHFALESGFGILLHYMPKQQDISGCLSKILGCPSLRELPTWNFDLSRPQRDLEGQSSKVGSLKKARTTQNLGQTSKKVVLYVYHNLTGYFVAFLGRD